MEGPSEVLSVVPCEVVVARVVRWGYLDGSFVDIESVDSIVLSRRVGM